VDKVVLAKACREDLEVEDAGNRRVYNDLELSH
jgi:hypothetical protein